MKAKDLKNLVIFLMVVGLFEIVGGSILKDTNFIFAGIGFEIAALTIAIISGRKMR